MKLSAILRRLESALKNNRTTALTRKDELRLHIHSYLGTLNNLGEIPKELNYRKMLAHPGLD